MSISLTDMIDDGNGKYSNLMDDFASFPAFMILHDDGENALHGCVAYGVRLRLTSSTLHAV